MPQTSHAQDLIVRLATTPDDLRAAQRLRYQVFVTELGGTGATVDHLSKTESDRFDAHCDHLLACDPTRAENNGVIGVYRLMRSSHAAAGGGFYSASEYDLSPLLRLNRPLLELGRSCLHADYRQTAAMYRMWTGLAAYVEQHAIEILFGVASFHGTDLAVLQERLSLLNRDHAAPSGLRPRALPNGFQPMDLLSEQQIDRRRAMLAMPPLIKAYLRLGGVVGEGAWVDHVFNTTDIMMILDLARMSPGQKSLYRIGSRL